MSAVTFTPQPRRIARSAIVAEAKLAAFNAWVKKHYGDQAALAEEVMTSRPHLSQILNGARRGKHTWKRLVKVLPEAGLLLLQQCPAWNNDAKTSLAVRRDAEDFPKRFGPKKPAIEPQPEIKP